MLRLWLISIGIRIVTAWYEGLDPLSLYLYEWIILGALAFAVRILMLAFGTLRRLLIMAAITVVRWAKREGVPAESWLGQMLARKPPVLVIVAVANKNARIAWALLTKGGVYRAPAATA